MAITGGRPVQFFAGFPDFSPWAAAVCVVDELTGTARDFDRADQTLVASLQLRSLSAARCWRREHRYTWHHHEDGRTLLLVPRLLHSNVPHAGGASRARRGETQAGDSFTVNFETSAWAHQVLRVPQAVLGSNTIETAVPVAAPAARI